MSVEILTDSHSDRSVFTCTTSDWAFGPIMGSVEEAEAFLKYLEPRDPREFKDDELQGRYSEFRRLNVCECGEVRDTRPCDFCMDERPIEADGCHHWDEDGESCVESCQVDPEPTDGKRYVCPCCQIKAERTRKAVR